MSAEPESLQERRRRYVAAEISRAAMQLFAERGFDEVTVDEIAVAAGTSARTFFRYFASKDEVVLQYRRRLDARLVATLEARPADEGAFTALRNAYLETVVTPPADREKWALRSRVLLETPALRGRAQSEQTAGTSPLVAALADRMGVDPARDERPHLVAAATAAVAGAAFESWVLDGGTDDPATRLDASFDLLRNGLDGIDDVRPAARRVQSF
jgi:AcrR family transcriptional regulator